MPGPSFPHDLAEAHQFGRRHKLHEDLGRSTKWDEVDAGVALRLNELGRGNSGVRNAIWAAFYHGILAQETRKQPSWSCIVQQQLTRAFYRLPRDTVAELLCAHDMLQASAYDWRMLCSGAIAVARTASAFDTVDAERSRRKGRLYMPKLVEDYQRKIDLIYQPPILEGGFCLQIKSDATAFDTTFMIVDHELARTDRYLRRFLHGASLFERRNGGRWLAALLIVGQKPYFDQPDVANCPRINQGVRALLTTYPSVTEPTP